MSNHDFQLQKIQVLIKLDIIKYTEWEFVWLLTLFSPLISKSKLRLHLFREEICILWHKCLFKRQTLYFPTIKDDLQTGRTFRDIICFFCIKSCLSAYLHCTLSCLSAAQCTISAMLKWLNSYFLHFNMEKKIISQIKLEILQCLKESGGLAIFNPYLYF